MDQVNPYAASVHEGGMEPMSVPPLRIGSILRTAWAVYFSNISPILAVTSVIWIPLVLLDSYMAYFVFEEDDGVFYQLLDLTVGMVAAGAVIRIGAAAMQGEKLSWMEAIRDGMRAWPRMFFTKIVGSLAVAFALLAFVVPGLFLAVRLILIDHVAVLEKKSGMANLQRTFQLTEGSFWRLAGLWILTTVALFLFVYVFDMPVMLFPELEHWLMYAASEFALRLVVPFQYLVFVAAYFAGVERLKNKAAMESPPVDEMGTAPAEEASIPE